ncbi:MAG: hypothetical protein A2341_20720 [Deltaproteobacteria bacterium RIFOXYB12_FULL_58_9]|nr:MAG: hypothetical protein A2341_20720 [Deltaproteobacteria bacterium RIFOXYB12_FULL_58_9]
MSFNKYLSMALFITICVLCGHRITAVAAGTEDSANPVASDDAQPCTDHDQCLDTGFCYRKPPSHPLGVCASHDLGKPCRKDKNCMYNFCHKTDLNIDGVCSVPCAKDAQCPDGMACVMDEEHDAKGCKAN